MDKSFRKFNFLILLFLVFLGAALLEKNDYLGEVLDNRDAIKEMRAEQYYRESFLRKSSDFRRFPISTTIAMPEMKKEIKKFETVKKYEREVDESLKIPNTIFGIYILIALAGLLVTVVFRDFIISLIANISILSVMLFYDIELGKSVVKLGLDKKIFSAWGVSDTLHHIILVIMFIYMLAAILPDFINKKTKRNIPKENIENFKKELKSKYEWAKSNKFAYAMLAPAFIIVVLIIIYPFLYNFRISFSNLNLKRFISFLKGDKLYYNGLENYINIFSEAMFWRTLMRTLIWTFTNVFFHVVGGIFFALLLNRELKFKSFYQMVLVIPWAIPQFIAVLVWKGMYNTTYGTINIVLGKIINTPIFEFLNNMSPETLKKLYITVNEAGTITGVGIPWLSDPVWLFTGAIITNIWLGIPFMMMIALGGLQSIPETFYEAADIDGASAWQKIRHITIPQLKPVMTPAIIMGTVWTFNNINVIYLLSEDTLTGKVDILVTYVYKAAFNLYRYGYAAAFSAVIFAILMIFSIFMIKYSKVEEGVR